MGTASVRGQACTVTSNRFAYGRRERCSCSTRTAWQRRTHTQHDLSSATWPCLLKQLHVCPPRWSHGPTDVPALFFFVAHRKTLLSLEQAKQKLLLLHCNLSRSLSSVLLSAAPMNRSCSSCATCMHVHVSGSLLALHAAALWCKRSLTDIHHLLEL